jgi:hypothetical protein
MTDLGDPHPGRVDFSKAYAINNAGQIVGESRNVAGEFRAFRRPAPA